MAILIIKMENGNIAFKNLKGKYKARTLNPSNASISLRSDGQTFDVFVGGNAEFSFVFDDVTSTQIAPDAAVGTTDADALYTLLQESFFFDVAGGGVGEAFTVEAQSVAAAQVVAATISLPNDSIYTIIIWAKGKLVGGNNKVEVQNNVTIACNNAATVSSLGTAPVTRNGGFSVGQIPQMTVSLPGGNDVQIRVSSTIAQTVNWVIDYQLIAVTFNA